MTVSWRRVALVAVLVLPLLGPGLLWGKAALDRGSGPVWHVKIAGFDPRDLLHGRFIQFRYDWNEADGAEAEDAACAGPECCLCLSMGESGIFNPSVTRLMCNDPAAFECGSVVPVSAAMGTQRSYIPEHYADDLDTLVRTNPERFSVAVTVPGGHGAPIVNGLLLDNIPLKDYLRTHGGVTETP